MTRKSISKPKLFNVHPDLINICRVESEDVPADPCLSFCPCDTATPAATEAALSSNRPPVSTASTTLATASTLASARRGGICCNEAAMSIGSTWFAALMAPLSKLFEKTFATADMRRARSILRVSCEPVISMALFLESLASAGCSGCSASFPFRRSAFC